MLFFPPAEKYVSVIKDPMELEGEAREKLVIERNRLRVLAFARRAEQAMVNEADEGAGLLHPLQQDINGNEVNTASASINGRISALKKACCVYIDVDGSVAIPTSIGT